jgi:hypothetical protein
VVQWDGADQPGLMQFAAALAEDPGHTVVVLGPGAAQPSAAWEPVLPVLAARPGLIQLVPGSPAISSAVPLGQSLADWLGRTVLAQDGAALAAARGALFIPAGAGDGWLRMEPGRPPALMSRRFPAARWARDVLEQVAILGPAGDTVAEPVPGGAWLHPIGPAGETEEHRQRLMSWLAWDPGRIYVPLGQPGTGPLSLTDAEQFWRLLPGEARAAVRFVPYGPVEVPDGVPLGQALANRFGEPAGICTGLPWCGQTAGDGVQVQALRADGSPGWLPYASELCFDPAETDGAVWPPEVLSWRPPIAGLPEILPGVYAFERDTVVEVVPAGLLLRPEARPTGHEVARSHPLSPDEPIIFVDTTGPAGGVMPAVTLSLYNALDAQDRALCRVLESDPVAEPDLDRAEPTRFDLSMPEEADPSLTRLDLPGSELAGPELAETEPAGPEPTDPELNDPEPADPELDDPGPADPTPADSEPADLEPADRESVDPEPAGPEPAGPEPEPLAPLPPQPPLSTPPSASASSISEVPLVPEVLGTPVAPPALDSASLPGIRLESGPRREPGQTGASSLNAEIGRLATGPVEGLGQADRADGPAGLTAGPMAPPLISAPPAAPPAGAGPHGAVPAATAASGSRPAGPDGAGLRIQPVPSPEACAIPPSRGIAQERAWLRKTLNRQFDAAASMVGRVLAENPGLRTGSVAGPADLLTDLVAVRLYLSGSAQQLDEAVRGGTVGPHVPFGRCVAAGLGRLPSYRGATRLRATLDDAEWQWYRNRQVVTEWAFCSAQTSGRARLPGSVEFQIWSMTGRRTRLLEPSLPDQVLFLPGTNFKVLQVNDDGRREILLRELAAAEIGADGHVDLSRVPLDDLALNGLERAAAAWRDTGQDEELPGGHQHRFGNPPGLILQLSASASGADARPVSA